MHDLPTGVRSEALRDFLADIIAQSLDPAPPLASTVATGRPLADEFLLTTSEVAEQLGVSRRTLERWRANRRLPYRRVGTGVEHTYRPRDVDRLAAQIGRPLSPYSQPQLPPCLTGEKRQGDT
ncbi:MAG: hypothetical protein BGN86_03695 [Caulobacterales bacterium 68-7]|nr:MAG: hypothetical protein BGN86_03695 [Caulobacterales bacterium 68-7]